MSQNLPLPKGHLLVLAWIGVFILLPMLFGWTFTSLIDCGSGSACYVGDTDWQDSGQIIGAISAIVIIPVGLLVLPAWTVSLSLHMLSRAPDKNKATAFPYRPYALTLLILAVPSGLASLALWLGFGAPLVDPNAASSIALWAANVSLLALIGLLIWILVYVPHMFIASYRASDLGRRA